MMARQGQFVMRAAGLLLVLVLACLLLLLAFVSEAEAAATAGGGGGGEGDQQTPGHRRELGRRHGGRRKRQQDEEGVVFDKTTIPYCNFPNTVSIPPLDEGLAARTPGLRLLQVQVVARHGSRTPYRIYSPTCWSGYGFKWDCNVTDLTLADFGDEDGYDDGRPAPWIFRKIYDGSPTVLGGTCHLGQLVREGFEQEVDNGHALARAYVGPGPLKLFANTHLGAVKAEHLYLRSDDDPSFRTEMSGEFLVRGLFSCGAPVTLLWHTGDFELDDLYPNSHVCPALRDVEADAYASREWAEVERSDWVRRLNRRMREELPGFAWDNMLDCLGTTSCTDRPFPSSLSRRTFDDAFAFASLRKAFPFHWNDAYFSKLAMGPFAKTLLGNLQASAAGDSPLRFGLFLAHDTTVLPLLCAWGVWDGAWPSYAAMLAIELYEAHGDSSSSSSGSATHYVRLVYAGQELVLPGCEGPLCPLRRLVELTEPWAMDADDPARPCWTSGPPPPPPPPSSSSLSRGRGRDEAQLAAAMATAANGEMEEEVEDALPASSMEPRSLPSAPAASASASASSAPAASGETPGAYIQNPNPSPVGNPAPSSSSSSSSFGTAFLSLLLGVAVGVGLTVAWGRRRQAAGYVGVPEGGGGGGGGGRAAAVAGLEEVYRLPDPYVSALDRGRYLSI